MPVADRVDDRPSGWAHGLRRNWQLVASVALGLIVAVPVVVSGLDAWGVTWFPVGDWAIIELRTLDVGGRRTPLLGPYSRYGWNHPGPLLFWLYAAPYRLSGGSPWALLVTAAAVNAGSLAGMLAFAWRRGRLPLVGATAVALSLIVLNVEPGMVRDPWNPWVTVLPFGLLVVVVWSAVEGDRLALPVAALVGSFLVQTHVGFLLLVAVLWAWALFGFVRRGGPRRALAWGAGVLALCWVPVLVDLIFGRHNLVEMASHFLGDGDEPAGWSVAVGIAARQLGHVAPWLGGDEPPNPIGGALLTRSLDVLVVPVVAFAIAAALVAWRRDLAAVRFQATVAIAAVVGVLSVARVTDEVFNYLVRWWWLVAALWWVSIAWSCWSALVDIRPAAARTLAPIAGAAALVAVTWFSVAALGEIDEAPVPIPDWQPAMSDVAADAIAHVSAGRPVLLDDDGPSSGWALDGIAARLEGEGIEVRVRDDDVNVNKFGAHRLVDGDEAVTPVWIVTGTPIEHFATDSRFTLIASYDPLGTADRERYRTAEAALFEQLRAAGLLEVVDALERGLSLFPARDHPAVDQDLLSEVDDLRRAGQPLAVFEQVRATGASRPAG
jgi:hypothetical protein